MSNEIAYKHIVDLMDKENVKTLCLENGMPIHWQRRIDTNRSNGISHLIEYSGTREIRGVDRVINGRLYRNIKNFKNQVLSPKLKNMFPTKARLFEKCGYLPKLPSQGHTLFAIPITCGARIRDALCCSRSNFSAKWPTQL